jgi:hypothetical protein
MNSCLEETSAQANSTEVASKASVTAASSNFLAKSFAARALHRFDPGFLAAAWWLHGRIAFLSLRQSLNPLSSGLDRERLTVVLGVTEPATEDPDSGGDEARVAAGIVSTLIH